jgi:2-polyprenyl-3-methyl-5-hydroxy-6-metoxy-1,4-benzoquinol methylase
MENRLAALEEENSRLRQSLERANPELVDAAMRELSTRVKGGKPNNSYFNVRFRHFEAAAADIRVLGSALGRQTAEAKLLGRKPGTPPRARPKCKLCTQSDLEADWALYWSDELKLTPKYHRKLWEFVYIAQALWAEDKLRPGAQGLGFGCGSEPLPSLFAKYSASVLATDLSAADPASAEWMKSNQHSQAVEALRSRAICPDDSLLANIDFRPQDMRNIDADLFGKFDFCWSACALEHLGSINDGLDFIRNSLKTLKPGGVAVHTTEFTFDEAPAHETWPTVLYKKAHLEEFFDRLTREGFQVAEVDLSPGTGLLDRFADLQLKELTVKPLSSELHLRTVYDGYVCTSVGMVVTVP